MQRRNFLKGMGVLLGVATVGAVVSKNKIDPFTSDGINLTKNPVVDDGLTAWYELGHQHVPSLDTFKMSDLPVDELCHVAVIDDEKSIKVYVNGCLEGVVGNFEQIVQELSTMSYVQIPIPDSKGNGRTYTTWIDNRHKQASISNIRIYDRRLSESEMNVLYLETM